MFVKRYYCKKCKAFKSRLQLKRIEDARSYSYQCRYCHSYDISESGDMIQEISDKIGVLDALYMSQEERLKNVETDINNLQKPDSQNTIKSLDDAAKELCNSLVCDRCPITSDNTDSPQCYHNLVVWLETQSKARQLDDVKVVKKSSPEEFYY